MYDTLKVSVIVPVYNAAEYLDRTIASVLRQTYRNLELVMVDDASTDHSLRICREHQKRDDRLKIVCNEENAGSGYAKNRGLEHMSGDVICFLDDDDYLIRDDIISRCMDCMVSADADIVCFGYCDDDPADRRFHYTFGITEELTGRIAAKRLFYCDGLDSNPWGKLYKKSVYGDLRFPVGMVYDDANVTYKAILRADRVILTGIPGYSHTSRPSSISGSYYKEKDWDYIINVQKTIDDLKDETDDLKQGAQLMLGRASGDLLMKYGHGGCMEKDKYRYLLRNYREHYSALVKNIEFGRYRIWMFLLRYGMIGVMRTLYSIKKK
ncbi:MAG: glycosyltransferase family 2 protein [Lachnospiraceae bacterium]|nr:glycosyltransferase family 2 protein [Lachnospiraceae bacterium]